MNQEQALKILKSGENVFLTGSAGTGKTFLLNKFIEYLKEREIKVGVTASTGIAATHLGGRTIHSWLYRTAYCISGLQYKRKNSRFYCCTCRKRHQIYGKKG